MPRFLLMAALIALVAGGALAETPVDRRPAAAPAKSPAKSIAALPSATPSEPSPSPATAGAPPAITYAAALVLLQGRGFRSITRLERDSDGIWLGAARRGNQIVDVAVDQAGNVITW